MVKIKRIKASVCVTTFNESKETINKLISALNSQTLKPDEIIIIDAKNYHNCSRSKGRNIAIRKARNKIIAITDAGCIPHNNWLEKITDPFKNDEVDVVAGSYKMTFNNNFEKAETVFLGIKQKDIGDNFLPSARSMALTKLIWKKAGGFPEELQNTAEDSLFNLRLIELSAKFKVSRNAVVDWKMPDNIYSFVNKIYGYSKGDAQSKVWWHPLKKFKTHNIKVLTIFMRYIVFIIFPWTTLFYFIYAFIKAGFWGILLQVASDFSAMFGFINGLIEIS